MFGGDSGEGPVEWFLQEVEVADNRESWKESRGEVRGLAAELGSEEKCSDK